MIHSREHWGSRLGFILAAAGSAIGLGSIWRFPYTAGDNGGGAFVILYIIMTLVISLPVFIGALIVGRRSQKGAVHAYGELSHRPSWKGVGWLNMITVFIILSYYSVVSGWCLNYALMSLNQFAHGRTPDEIRNVFQIVYKSASMNVFFLILFLLCNIGILVAGVRKGIERWNKILMPALFIIMLGLLFYSMSFKGFGAACEFIFAPDFHKLTPKIILNALGMSFFTLSVGLGILVTYGSYLKPDVNIPKTGLLVACATLLISLVASLVIFPIVFTYNLPPQGGPGLIFQTMPVLFAKLPGNLIVSTVFFLLVVFTALTSTVSLFEVLISNLMEVASWSRLRATLTSTIGVLILALPSASGKIFPSWTMVYGKDFFDTMNYITASWMMPIAALLTTLFVGWVLPKQLVYEEFMQGQRSRFFLYPWYFIVKWLAPVVVILIILREAGVTF
ncbi:MAG: hypothetical protein SP1CHLAM54_00290 [Chlamydiia bacterium]|nr:hypothetical protein [Chlamydiia bacterium]MCH9614951.1 hypothetical protein [Chlamydiia bacterium]MCH9629999.1 hypothetical protein [Chlamydiia bacterium]